MSQSAGAVGVLLVNLGSPSAPTPTAVRGFLDEFLSDTRVVDMNPLLWRALRRLVILPRRTPKVAKLYESIWMSEGSPLVVYSRRQATLLAAELGASHRVALAMRYGAPSIVGALAELTNCRELVVVPLFPQYSRTTTGTIEAAVSDELSALAQRPKVRGVADFHVHPAYIAALATRVEESLRDGPVDHFVFTFHGLPQRYVEMGDPYRTQCEATAVALATKLGLAKERWTLVYQSRFGRERWLQPYADEFVPALAATKKRVLVIAPGFVSDCLETLEELGQRLAESFVEAGGQELRVVPCLNDHPSAIKMLAALVRGE
ncbi:MAG: ferrochelatase [Planctomycetes bacterium]|nr:ferrochelatase [Planctomycetota bacterium]